MKPYIRVLSSFIAIIYSHILHHLKSQDSSCHICILQEKKRRLYGSKKKLLLLGGKSIIFQTLKVLEFIQAEEI